MKILKEGRDFDDIRTNCYTCEAVLLVSFWDCYPEYHDGFYEFVCPCCKMNNKKDFRLVWGPYKLTDEEYREIERERENTHVGGAK